MAKFYEPTPIKENDWTSSSKGYKAASVAGDLFEGAGDLVKMASTAADTYNQGMIKEEANTATQRLYDDYGRSSAVDVNAGVDGKVTPKEINDGAKRLQLLKTATANGSLKGSSYWSQAELISRQLKMRYPGYWEQIDSTMSGILGRKPANAVVSEIQSENEKAAAEANAKAKEGEADYRRAVEDAKTAGIIDPFIAEQKGRRMSTTDINLMVASKNAVRLSQSALVQDFEIKKAQRSATEEDALLAQRTEAQGAITTALKNSTSPLAKDAQEYRSYVDQIQSYKKAGQPVPPALEQQIAGAAQRVEQTVADLTNQYTLKYADTAGYNKMKENIGFLADWTKNYISGVREGDRALTGTNVAILNSLQNHDTYKFLTHPDNDILRKSSILSRIMGPQAEAQWWLRNQDTKIGVDAYMSVEKAMANRSLLDGRPLRSNIKDMQGQNVKDPNVYNEHFTKVIDATSAEEMPPQLKSNAIESVYGKDNMDFLQKDVKPNERLPMFLKAAAPLQITKLKAAFDKGEISVDDYNKHVNWTMTNGMHLIRDQAAEINGINPNRRSTQVVYDPKNHILKLVPQTHKSGAASMVGRAIVEATESLNARNAHNAVLNVDTVLNTLKVLIKANGDDPNELIPQILAQAGIDVSVQEKAESSGAEGAVRAVENKVSGVTRDAIDTVSRLAEMTKTATAPYVNQAVENLSKESGVNLGLTEKRTQISKDLDDVLGKIENQEDKSTIRRLVDELLGGLVVGSVVSE